jgi:hypothetical protein
LVLSRGVREGAGGFATLTNVGRVRGLEWWVSEFPLDIAGFTHNVRVIDEYEADARFFYPSEVIGRLVLAPAHADLVSSGLHALSLILTCIAIIGSTAFPYLRSIIAIIGVCNAAMHCSGSPRRVPHPPTLLCIRIQAMRAPAPPQRRYRPSFPRSQQPRACLGTINGSEGLTLGGRVFICCLGHQAVSSAAA